MLPEDGYITYITGSGNQCGTYSLNDLSVNYDTHCDILPENQSDKQPQFDTPSDTPYDTLSDKQVALQTITLTKQNINKTKQFKKRLSL